VVAADACTVGRLLVKNGQMAAPARRDALNILIKKADRSHLGDCLVALRNSRLGQEYFASEAKALAALTAGIAQEEVFVAVSEEAGCLGFIWFILGGAFHSFPYLHIIAVKEAFRGRGIGTRLLDYFERAVFTDFSKVFMVVADFNPDARRLYESLGYRQVGVIPGLYKEGVTEYLMMKERDLTGSTAGPIIPPASS
jgi:ribosomal protein S18 acetylase RimI-like enzyme